MTLVAHFDEAQRRRDDDYLWSRGIKDFDWRHLRSQLQFGVPTVFERDWLLFAASKPTPEGKEAGLVILDRMAQLGPDGPTFKTARELVAENKKLLSLFRQHLGDEDFEKTFPLEMREGMLNEKSERIQGDLKIEPMIIQRARELIGEVFEALRREPALVVEAKLDGGFVIVSQGSVVAKSNAAEPDPRGEEPGERRGRKLMVKLTPAKREIARAGRELMHGERLSRAEASRRLSVHPETLKKYCAMLEAEEKNAVKPP